MGFTENFEKAGLGDEETLSYDDSAWLFFLTTVLLCFAIPWTVSTLQALLFPAKTFMQNNFPVANDEGKRIRYCMISAQETLLREKRAQASLFKNRFTGCVHVLIFNSKFRTASRIT